MAYEFLNAAFIEAMNEIGEHGFVKYGDLPQERSKHRNPERVTRYKNAEHAEEHFFQYLRGTPHDHFKTRRHQLAAVAFNAMMEFQFAGLEDE